MSSDHEIRPVVDADIPRIKAIADATELFSSETLDEMIAGYLGGTTADFWFAALADGQVISFGFCEPERMTEGTWNLLAIGVLPDRQGEGVGRAMIAYLENRLATEGARVLIVETMGTPELALTRKFYGKNGYTEEARIREFYEAGADKVVYWKHL